jgi:SWI/SNF-related matrix-associated actin-dependent regulator 1 of chromatin subfamily A
MEAEPRHIHGELKWWYRNRLYDKPPAEAQLSPIAEKLLSTPPSRPTQKPTELSVEFWESLYDFQKESVSDIVWRKNGCVLLSDDMGLGKTRQAIAVIKSFPHDRPVLITAPASMRTEWLNRLRLLAPERQVTLLDSHQDGLGSDINILSYDLMASVKMFPKLKTQVWRFLVLDESHRIKNRESQRCKCITELAKHAIRRVLLSGTPLNRPVELYAQIRLVNPQLYPKFWRPHCPRNAIYFSNRYCKPTQTYISGGRRVWVHKGAERLMELNAVLLHCVMIRRTADQVLSLPNKSREIISLGELPAEILKRKLERFQWLKEDQGRKLQADKEFMELVRDTLDKKIPLVVKYYQDVLSRDGSQILIFSRHHSMTDALREVIPESEVVVIDGRVPKQQRGALVDLFQSGAKRIALLSIEAASEGLTLTRATLVVFAELAFVPNLHLQAEARAHRNGQTEKVTVRYLLMNNTTDDIIWNLLCHKLIISSRTLDNTYRTLGKRIPNDEEQERKEEEHKDKNNKKKKKRKVYSQ